MGSPQKYPVHTSMSALEGIGTFMQNFHSGSGSKSLTGWEGSPSSTSQLSPPMEVTASVTFCPPSPAFLLTEQGLGGGLGWPRALSQARR
jgi:hypothetical protein